MDEYSISLTGIAVSAHDPKYGYAGIASFAIKTEYGTFNLQIPFQRAESLDEAASDALNSVGHWANGIQGAWSQKLSAK